ncbi:hypothetical protein [Sandarakinorhabdus sp. AAP62]|uniref:hypothetical protein n=1 Tax=Sandarakinorhabdus sp. AAP62 TaxID=1248916 RepID=UPI0002DFCE23|nr:hypothetical protein [Sandarakinorhabdus sp. AAP62]
MTRGFWEHCLHAWVWLTIGFGLLFSGAGVPGLDGGAGLFYWLVSGGMVDASAFDAPGMRISVSLVGAVMLGWGCAMLAVFRACGADPAVWRGLSRAVIIWWAVDSALSVMTGFALNAVSNTLFLALFLVPAVKLGFFGQMVRA